MDFDDLFQIKSNNLKPAKGRILISGPTIDDAIFRRSVILILDHEEDGTFGVIMNKPEVIESGEILNIEIPENEFIKIYCGGPVELNKIFFTHSFGEIIPESIKIMDGIYWGGDTDVVDSLIQSGTINLKKFQFYFGYSGWEKGQLEDELGRNSWLVANATAMELLFIEPEKMWSYFVEKMGTKYKMWSRIPKSPYYN